jgi:hypothetical protein
MVLVMLIPAAVLAATVQTSGPSDQQYAVTRTAVWTVPAGNFGKWADVPGLGLRSVCTGSVMTVLASLNVAGGISYRLFIDRRRRVPSKYGLSFDGNPVSTFSFGVPVTPGLHSVVVQVYWTDSGGGDLLYSGSLVVFGTTGC